MIGDKKDLCLMPMLENQKYDHFFNEKEISMYNTGYRYLDGVSGKNKPDMLLCMMINDLTTWIGNISLNNINHIDRSAEIAIIMDRGFHGKGYGKKACYLLIHHALYSLNLIRIYFGTHENNTSMIAIGESLGFKLEGISRNALFKRDRYWNVFNYGLLKEEFNL